MVESHRISGLSFTSPRLRGEVGFVAKREIRVRGTIDEPDAIEAPPHPNPLPASGARGFSSAAMLGEGS
jgi:hypothetical protein